jgi:hypothetical protein
MDELVAMDPDLPDEPLLAETVAVEPADEPAPPQPVEHRNGKTDRAAEADGVAPGRRATVPSWDEILFGTRPPEH